MAGVLGLDPSLVTATQRTGLPSRRWPHGNCTWCRYRSAQGSLQEALASMGKAGVPGGGRLPRHRSPCPGVPSEG